MDNVADPSTPGLSHQRGSRGAGYFISSFGHFCAVCGDPILAANVSTSTFNMNKMTNDGERASTSYVPHVGSGSRRLPSLCAVCREILRKSVTIDGGELRGNLWEAEFDFRRGGATQPDGWKTKPLSEALGKPRLVQPAALLQAARYGIASYAVRDEVGRVQMPQQRDQRTRRTASTKAIRLPNNSRKGVTI